MVVIKKQGIKGYILLEALLALTVFSMIASLFLQTLGQQRQQLAQQLQLQEVYLVANTALQTGRQQLTLNGVRVSVERAADRMQVNYAGEPLLEVVRVD